MRFSIYFFQFGSSEQTQFGNLKKNQSKSKESSIGEELTSNPSPCSDNNKISTQENQLRKLKNTFGWARIDVIAMLICCVFLASFSFSIFVEALQTLVHIDHQDEMHYPIPVMIIGKLLVIFTAIQ